jgi:hypothetical protein
MPCTAVSAVTTGRHNAVSTRHMLQIKLAHLVKYLFHAMCQFFAQVFRKVRAVFDLYGPTINSEKQI